MSVTAFAVRQATLRHRADFSYIAGRSAVMQLQERSRFPLVPLGELATLIQYGSSQRASTVPEGTPIIRMGNLQDDGWDLRDLKYVTLDDAELARYRLEPGDILFNRTNSKDLVGKCAVFAGTGEWVFASYLIRVQADTQRVSPNFLVFVINSNIGRWQIDSLSRQIAGMSNINSEEIRELLIPLPSLEVQAVLAEEAEAGLRDRAALRSQSDDLLRELNGVVVASLGVVAPVAVASDGPTVAARGDLLAAGRFDVGYFQSGRGSALSALTASGQPLTTLGEVAAIIRQPVDELVGPVGLANVRGEIGELLPGGEEQEPAAALAFEPGDVLYGRLRPNLNKVWLADHHGRCSTEFRVLRPTTPDISPGYLAAVLRAPTTVAQASAAVAGNTLPRIADDDLLQVVIPQPSLEVQRQIEGEVRSRQRMSADLRRDALEAWRQAKETFEAALLTS